MKNCHTCGHEYQGHEMILQQHGIVVCANLNCCWKKYQPPPHIGVKWRLSNIPAVRYNEAFPPPKKDWLVRVNDILKSLWASNPLSKGT